MIDWTDEELYDYLWNRRARISVILKFEADYEGHMIEYAAYYAPQIAYIHLN